MNLRNISFIIFSLIFSLNLIAQSLSLKDIWLDPKYNFKDVTDIHHFKNGKQFTRIIDGASAIALYNYETGNQEGILFHSDWSDEDLKINSYLVNEDDDKIILATNTEKIYRRSKKSDHFIWDRKKKELQPLAAGAKQMNVSFSPDGNKIAYVQENDLFYLDLKTNKTHQITRDGKFNHIINGAADWVYEEEFYLTKAYDWSPDSRKISFLKFDEKDVRIFSLEKTKDNYPEIYSFKYPKAGEKNAIVTAHVYHIENGKVTALPVNKQTEYYLPRIQWTKDPDVVSIQRINRHQNNLELLFVNVNDLKVRTVLTDRSEQYVKVHDDLKFFGNDQFLWTSEQDGFNHIYLFNINGKLERQLTKGNWEVTSIEGVDIKKGIVYYLSTEVSPLQRQLYTVDLKGKKNRITKENGTYKASFSNDFSYYVLKHSAANTPMTVSIQNHNHKLIRILEDNNQLKKLLKEQKVPAKEFFSFKTSENIELNGYMIKPVNFDENKKYPVLMYVYGGPGSQRVLDSWNDKNEMWFRYLAENDVIIACVDNRGTGARGADFKKMTYLNLGHYETIDQIEAGKYLAEQSYVDKENIGIFGWSYGGYISAMALFKGNDIFNMAISVAPVTHWKFYDTVYTERFMRTPDENKEGYENSSLAANADKMKGSLLLIHGIADDNVHVQNTYDLVNALVIEQKQFDLFLYPDKDHSIAGNSTKFHLYTKMTNFIFNNFGKKRLLN